MEKTEKTPKDRLVFALDVDEGKEAEDIIENIGADVGWMKMNSIFLGAYVYLRDTGKDLLAMIDAKGSKRFMDLKFHDIPFTLSKYVKQLKKLGVGMFNVHTQGSIAMMKTAVETVNEIYKDDPENKPIILGVTILTSINQQMLEDELGYKVPLKEQVVFLAKKAKEAGLDGVVASVHEVKRIKEACGEDFLVLTPGIKFEEEIKDTGKQDDQQRKATPDVAAEEGSNFIVMGRSLLKNVKENVPRALNLIGEGLKRRKAA
ncbi:MAG: orotidine-5'-phosphate decarboxylase [Parcubacteria group bacterium]